MRGKAIAFKRSVLGFGITPAYAGKSGVRGGLLLKNGDHPRLCGEKYSYSTDIRLSLGSPPPMRGKAAYAAGVCLVARITPAYAGKRRLRSFGLTRWEDHPRLCGEKFTPIFSQFGDDRITPAYAGKSF